MEADLLLHVMDASADDVEQREEAVEAVLKEIGAAERPRIAVLNKADRIARVPGPRAAGGAAGVGRRVRADRRGAGRPAAPRSRTGWSCSPRSVRLRFKAGDRRGIAGVYTAGRVMAHEVEDGHVTLDAELPRADGRSLPGAPRMSAARGADRRGPGRAALAASCATAPVRPTTTPETEEFVYPRWPPGEVRPHGGARRSSGPGTTCWPETRPGAEKRLRKVLPRQPRADPRRDRARLRPAAGGRPRGRGARLRRVLERKPDDVSALVGSGIALGAARPALEAALAAYARAAAALDPANEAVRRRRAELRLQVTDSRVGAARAAAAAGARGPRGGAVPARAAGGARAFRRPARAGRRARRPRRGRGRDRAPGGGPGGRPPGAAAPRGAGRRSAASTSARSRSTGASSRRTRGTRRPWRAARRVREAIESAADARGVPADRRPRRRSPGPTSRR